MLAGTMIFNGITNLGNFLRLAAVAYQLDSSVFEVVEIHRVANSIF